MHEQLTSLMHAQTDYTVLPPEAPPLQSSPGHPYATSIRNATRMPFAELLLTETLHPSDLLSRSPPFHAEKRIELSRLEARGAFRMEHRSSHSHDANLLRSRFVLFLKQTDAAQTKAKDHFVVQGHMDVQKHMIIHTSSTARVPSIRLLMSITSMFNFTICSVDFTQAYLPTWTETYISIHRVTSTCLPRQSSGSKSRYIVYRTPGDIDPKSFVLCSATIFT